MQRKLTYKEIRSIPAGESRVFEFFSYAAMASAKVSVWQVSRLYPNPDIEKYHCEQLNTGSDGFALRITAVQKRVHNNEKG